MTLDDFRRCPVPGCEWHIRADAGRCFLHRGPALPQFRQRDDGEVIDVRFMPREHDPDYEPDDAA